jgi:hypothetical protein
MKQEKIRKIRSDWQRENTSAWTEGNFWIIQLSYGAKSFNLEQHLKRILGNLKRFIWNNLGQKNNGYLVLRKLVQTKNNRLKNNEYCCT